MFSLGFLTTLLYCLASAFAENANPLVHTKVGPIRGLRASDGDYSMFLGIPYARVNDSNIFGGDSDYDSEQLSWGKFKQIIFLGKVDLYHGPSLPYPYFEEPFNAYDGSKRCPQKDVPSPAEGSLDCLRLNIHVPNSASERNLLPVMVYIHGGSYQRGYAGLYGAKLLVRHDVIFVAINYRLELYGLLCLDTPEVPGNQVLKDQLAALRWVKGNIQSFGGDVDKITVFGESVGGRSIDLHLNSPQEKLFNSAIMQSGTSFTRDNFREADRTVPIKLCEILGLPSDSLAEALTSLSSVDPIQVIEAVYVLGLEFAPCVEKQFENVEAFIPDHPVNTKLPKVKDMPILIGYNNNEQVVRYADKPDEYFDDLNIIYDRLNKYFDFDNNTLEEMTGIVHEYYLGDEAISKETMWGVIDFDSEFSYCYPTERTIRKCLENGSGNIYKYVFSYKGGRNMFSIQKGVPVGGAGHADEVAYLFDVASFTPVPQDTDPIMIDIMTTLWTNFAKYGNPTPEPSPLVSVKWEPVTADKNYYLDLNLTPSLHVRDLQDQTAFWDLFFKHNWKAQRGYHD